jgi:ABC-type antimicrobial peptide transport system permease subunit
VTWRDAIGLAGRELRRRPGRAALTLMAVTLATALLSALLAVAGTAQTRVLSQIANGGPLASISVSPAASDPTQVGLDNPRSGPARDLTVQALARIRALPHVRSVVPVTATEVTVVPPALPPKGSTACRETDACHRDPSNGNEPDRPVRPIGTAIVGVNLHQLGNLPVSLLSGRFPAVNATDQVDVTQEYLSHLGLAKTKAAEVVGSQITIGSRRFAGTETVGNSVFDAAVVGYRWTTATVVGVVQQEAAPGDVLVWPPLAQQDFGWVESGRALGDSNAPTSPYVQALVVADQLANVGSVRTAIAEVGYTSSAQESIITAVGHYLHVVEIVLSGIGVVALAIAALGIANALMAAVRERRREIGVLKAIGARDRDVMRTFLVEAGTLGFVGGVLGTALGAVIALVIGGLANQYLESQGLAGVRLDIPVLLPLGAVLGATAVAIMAGVLPARRAARLPAREAMEA